MCQSPKKLRFERLQLAGYGRIPGFAISFLRHR
jgi:hypothetical protein